MFCSWAVVLGKPRASSDVQSRSQYMMEVLVLLTVVAIAICEKVSKITSILSPKHRVFNP